ncbi:nucleotidyltransferase domain-containing protein [Clostridium sp.]|uniref:nucleotidyltransferase domain-containing protein n=1 Tax=Clostridium sp. TaxID=1506 RepID=UPI00262F9BFC|nr:nucleotidyltransferase domain-containing protein [Clostridium sp.]
MGKQVIDYQNAYKEITEKLIKNENTLAIFVFGSMVSGDIWEESDIDLFVIYKNDFKKLRDVYMEVFEIPIHIKFLSKESFNKSLLELEREGELRNTLTSSKLIYSIDNEVSEIYQRNIYLVKDERKLNNLIYLGELLKEIGVCKKYLSTGGILTAYEVIFKALNSFSKLYLNLNGYRVSKDSLSMACNLNDNLNNNITELIYEKEKDVYINDIIKIMDKFIDDNLENSTSELINILNKENKKLSAYDLKSMKPFNIFNMKMEDILKRLYYKGVIKKEKRGLLLNNEKEILCEENVYFLN